MTRRIKGLYAVTPDWADTQLLLSRVEAVLRGGVGLLQYRNKMASAELRCEQARALLSLCRRYDIPLIVNDHVALAHEIGADGVHLGGDDGDIAAARSLMGRGKLIGASCYDRLDLARQAEAKGADYVAFGACFNSGTKPAAVRAPLELFAQARRDVRLPLVGIGGITPKNMREVLAAGADAVAMISALFGESRDIAAVVEGIKSMA